MTTEVLGNDTIYIFELDGKDLIITFKGDSPKGVAGTWHDRKTSFQTQLENILCNHHVENVYFQGDRFGKGLFHLCRYELQSMLNKKCSHNFKMIEDSAMKMIYIEDSIVCTNRCSEACDNGLTIEMDAPLDTEIHLKREDGVIYDAVAKNGIVKVPREFLDDGHYLLYAVKPGGLPTNTLNMDVKTGREGTYISCKKDYEDLLDAVYKLMKAHYNTEKRVSAHIDGYEVI